jgi:hypothetical protein
LGIVKNYGGPSCLSVAVSESKSMDDEKPSTVISMTPQGDKFRRHSLPPVDQIVTIQQVGSHSAPATLKRKDVNLTECTIVLIGEEGEKTVILKNHC